MPEIAQHRFLARTLHLQTMLRQVDRFIAPSAFLRDRYVDWGLPAAKIAIVANGVPADEPAPATRRARRTFGFFGNIAPHKGVLVALTALTEVAKEQADVRLHLHGGLNFQPEPFRSAFDEAVAAAQPAARSFGAYRRPELPGLMADVDWVVVPSVWWENAPLVILEAFRHHRPLICSNIGGMAEMVRDGINGLHFRAGDPHDLARVMLRAVRQRGLWRRLVDGLPAPSTIAEATDRHLALYQSLSRHEEALSA
jgi:glycosyltransferase involved in cell wall biosynthesis